MVSRTEPKKNDEMTINLVERCLIQKLNGSVRAPAPSPGSTLVCTVLLDF